VKLFSAPGRVVEKKDDRGHAFVVSHPAVPEKVNLHGHKQWFAVRKFGGREAAKQAAHDELEVWRQILQSNLQNCISMTVCFNQGMSVYECGCTDSLAKHCNKFCMIDPGSFEYKLLDRPPDYGVVSDLVTRVTSMFSKRSAKKACMTPVKPKEASASPGKSPQVSKEIKRHKGRQKTTHE